MFWLLNILEHFQYAFLYVFFGYPLAYLNNSNEYGNSIDRIETSASSTSSKMSSEVESAVADSNKTGKKTKTASASVKTKETDWELVSAQIGDAVGAQIVNAMKSGQMKFIFSGNNEGIMEVS